MFAIVDSKSNCLLDFGIATEVRYAEIFSYKSALTDKAKDVCIAPIKRPLEKFDFGKSKKSKDLEESECLGELEKSEFLRELEGNECLGESLSWDDAMAILEARYGSNYIAINNGDLKIQDWQAAKKVNHAVCFGINPSDYGISQKQLLEINKKGGIVTYLQRGNKLPSLDLIRAYQNAIKTFCEDPNLSVRNDESTFGGIEESITFFNPKTLQVAIFKRKTKGFITAYTLSYRQSEQYKLTQNIGIINKLD